MSSGYSNWWQRFKYKYLWWNYSKCPEGNYHHKEKSTVCFCHGDYPVHDVYIYVPKDKNWQKCGKLDRSLG